MKPQPIPSNITLRQFYSYKLLHSEGAIGPPTCNFTHAFLRTRAPSHPVNLKIHIMLEELSSPKISRPPQTGKLPNDCW